MAEQGQKTEPPTQRKLEKARRDGRFPASREFVASLQFVVFVFLVQAGASAGYAAFADTLRRSIREAFRHDLDGTRTVAFCTGLAWSALRWFGAVAALLTISALAAQLAITRMGLSLKKVAPDVQRLSPLNRLREMPRQNFSGAVRAAVMLPLLGMAVWMVAWDNVDRYYTLPLRSAAAGVGAMGSSLLDLLWKAAGLFLVIGLVDVIRERRRYMRDLGMSRQEIRDEVKEMEGNPQVKMRIRQLQRDRLRRRMMQQVPKATAVIVNPTHYAVAIRYVAGEMAAPMVVAKGKNYIARRIRETAVSHQIPVIENQPLAQALYKSVEIGQHIPAHLYRAVAEVLAYIYKLMRK